MRLSRHARNNMRLYKILEKEIRETIESPDFSDVENDRIIAIKGFSNKFAGYPLKVVYIKTEGELLVITAFPLKRKHWR